MTAQENISVGALAISVWQGLTKGNPQANVSINDVDTTGYATYQAILADLLDKLKP